MLHPNPASPWWMHAVSATALTIHIGGGIVGLLSGTAALIVRKGGRLHRITGDLFVIAMLIMAAVGAAMALLLQQWPNVLGGTFTFYLIGSGWTTMHRPPDQRARLDTAAMLFAAATAAMGASMTWIGAHNPGGTIGSQPYQQLAIFTAIAALAAIMDARMVARGGISGRPRLARHIWRMCLGVFVAAGSFFLGQQQVFPAVLQGAPILFVPVLGPLLAMAFWLVRIRFTSGLARINEANKAVFFEKKNQKTLSIFVVKS
jgi:uncharacterized membrane protein